MGVFGAHIGQVGGHTLVVQDSFDRPANTTQYAAGDALVDSASAPTPLEWAVGRVGGGSGVIIAALLTIDSYPTTKLDAHLWLFNATLTPPNDNGGCDLTDVEALTFIGIVDFGNAPDAVTNPTANAAGNCCYMQRALDIPFQCGAADTKVYGFLVAQNTYTPLSGENFAVSLGVLQD